MFKILFRVPEDRHGEGLCSWVVFVKREDRTECDFGFIKENKGKRRVVMFVVLVLMMAVVVIDVVIALVVVAFVLIASVVVVQ